MPGLNVTSQIKNEATVIQVTGSADMTAAAGLEATLQNIAGNKPALAVIDLTGCTFISSLCMAALAKFCQAVKHVPGHVKIVLLDGHVRDVLTRSRVIAMFEEAPSVNAAIST